MATQNLSHDDDNAFDALADAMRYLSLAGNEIRDRVNAVGTPSAPGREAGTDEAQTTTAALGGHPDDDDDDGEPWGHLGVRLVSDARTRWYPVRYEQALAAASGLRDAADWLTITTLNNRALMIQPTAVQAVRLIGAGDDRPDDWSVSWDMEPLGTAVYHGLRQYHLNAGRRVHGTPELKDEVRRIVKRHRLDDAALYALLSEHRMYYRDGTMSRRPFGAALAIRLFYTARMGDELPATCLPLAYVCGDELRFTPWSDVALLDTPLHLMRLQEFHGSDTETAAVREEL